jgi:hypothetical protein
MIQGQTIEKDEISKLEAIALLLAGLLISTVYYSSFEEGCMVKCTSSMCVHIFIEPP